MFSNFPKPTSSFLISNIVIYSASFIFQTLVNFFIWQKSGDIKLVVLYNSIVCLFWAIGSLISENLLSFFKARLVRTIGILISLLYAFLIVYSNSLNTTFVIILGIIYGLSSGIRSQAFYIIARNDISPENRPAFWNYLTNFDNLINKIILPVTTSQVIAFTQSYISIFIFAIILTFISVYILLSSPTFQSTKPQVEIYKFFKFFKESNSTKELFIYKIFDGFFHGITTTLISLITLYILGDIAKWGVFSTILIILQIIFSYQFAKKLKLKNSPIVLGIVACLYTIATILFFNYFNLAGLIIFSLFTLPFSAFYNNSAIILQEKVMDFEVTNDQLTDEVYMGFEFIKMFAASFILILIYIMNPNFENPLMLKLIILSLGVIVLTMFTFLTGLEIAKKRRNDPFLNA